MPASATFCLASLNTWKNEGRFPDRLAPLGQHLRAWNLDLLLLQECFARLDRDPATDTAARLQAATALPHLALAPARLARRLSPEPGPPDSTSGLAILSRHPVLDQTVLPLPGRPEGGERIALLVRLATPAGPVLAANLHLSHLRNAHAERRAQLETVLAHPWWRQPAALRLLGGDFNAPLSHESLDPLRAASAHFVAHDLLAALGPSRRSLLRVPPERGTFCVDHLFALVAPGEPAPQATDADLRRGDGDSSPDHLLSDHAAAFITLHLSP